MAAMGRLVSSLGSSARAFASRGTPAASTKALKVIAAGACVSAAAVAAYYHRCGGEGRIGARLPHLLGLPSVSASDKVKKIIATFGWKRAGFTHMNKRLGSRFLRHFCRELSTRFGAETAKWSETLWVT